MNQSFLSPAEKKQLLPIGSLVVLVILHTVGLFGLNSDAKEWFMAVTPVNLWISFLIIFLNQKSWRPQLVAMVTLAFLTGFMAEVAGVATGLIFGEYAYGNTLGFKLWGVPLTIGANWALLVFASGAITSLLKAHWIVKAILGAALMTTLDFVLEPVAMKLDFWSWPQNVVPLQNYIGWFVIALFLHLVYQKLVKDQRNPVGIGLFIIQFVFFTVLNLTL